MPKTTQQLETENGLLTEAIAKMQSEVTNLRSDPTFKFQAAELETSRVRAGASEAKAQAAESQVAAITAQREASELRLTAERDSLRAENTRLRGAMLCFDAKVAAEVAKHGIRPHAIAAMAEPIKEDGQGSLTAQCLAAKNLPPNSKVDVLASARNSLPS